jgi:hypothetical protein
MDYNEINAELLSELEALDNHIVKNIEKLFKQLTAKLLGLSALAGTGVLILIYRELIDSINAEMHIFESFLQKDLDNFFNRYWAVGERMAQNTINATGENFTAYGGMTGGLDKQAALNYINTVASGEVSKLRNQLLLEAQKALLGGEDVSKVIQNLSNITRNGQLQNRIILKITSELFGVVQAAQQDLLQAFLSQFPNATKLLRKTWHWSQVSRLNHAAMDGTTIPFKAKFHVPGNRGVPPADMEGPHDFSAPLGQTLNCKCLMSVSVIGASNG